MESAKSVVAEVKARGQLTIPKKIREVSHIEEGSVVSILPVGDSLIVTPKRIELDEARRQLKKLVKASGLTVEELMEGLKSERDELFKETYGSEKSCKVFLDSNVLLSGLFSGRGAPRIVLDLLTLKLPMLAGATGRYNLIEVERNLKNKMPEVLPLYYKYLPKLGLEIAALPSKETVESMAGVIADKDIPVLASALACGADYLITGDKKDFAKLKNAKKYNVVIVSPSEFVETIFPDIIKSM